MHLKYYATEALTYIILVFAIIGDALLFLYDWTMHIFTVTLDKEIRREYKEKRKHLYGKGKCR